MSETVTMRRYAGVSTEHTLTPDEQDVLCALQYFGGSEVDGKRVKGPGKVKGPSLLSLREQLQTRAIKSNTVFLEAIEGLQEKEFIEYRQPNPLTNTKSFSLIFLHPAYSREKVNEKVVVTA